MIPHTYVPFVIAPATCVPAPLSTKPSLSARLRLQQAKGLGSHRRLVLKRGQRRAPTTRARINSLPFAACEPPALPPCAAVARLVGPVAGDLVQGALLRADASLHLRAVAHDHSRPDVLEGARLHITHRGREAGGMRVRRRRCVNADRWAACPMVVVHTEIQLFLPRR